MPTTMLDRIIVFTRENGGLSIMRAVHRGRLAKMNLQRRGDEIVYTTDIKEDLGVIVLAGWPAPTENILSDADYAKAIAASAFESDGELLERLMARLPEGAADAYITTEDALPKDRSSRDAWRHVGDGAVKVSPAP